MIVQFFKDGRKTNTVEQFATDSEGRVLLDEKGRKVVEKEQIEFKTILLELPVYENTINFDKYGRGSKFHLIPDAEYQALTQALTSGKSLILDIRYLEFFKTIRTVADDAITEVEGA